MLMAQRESPQSRSWDGKEKPPNSFKDKEAEAPTNSHKRPLKVLKPLSGASRH